MGMVCKEPHYQWLTVKCTEIPLCPQNGETPSPHNVCRSSSWPRGHDCHRLMDFRHDNIGYSLAIAWGNAVLPAAAKLTIFLGGCSTTGPAPEVHSSKFHRFPHFMLLHQQGHCVAAYPQAQLPSQQQPSLSLCVLGQPVTHTSHLLFTPGLCNVIMEPHPFMHHSSSPLAICPDFVCHLYC